MNDDELIERLRRTFHERADGIQPGPGRLPLGHVGPEPSVAGKVGGPRGAAGAAAGVTGAGDEERRTAEYPSFRPTGPVPIVGRDRRRWPPVVGVGALVAAAAAAAVAIAVSSGKHPVTVRPADHGSPGQSAPAVEPTSPPNTAPVTAPSAPMGPALVPTGFRPESVTFVSTQDGWAIGSAPGRCLVLAQTSDGGRIWWQAGGPDVAASCPGTSSVPSPSYEVRFANTSDGWIWTIRSSGTPSRLWSTHDGGATWTPETLPLVDATIGALETSGGLVHMAIFGTCPGGSAGCQGQTVEEILTSPIGTDGWNPSALSPSIGAGPVLNPQITLWGADGWLINDNRTVVSAARLSPTTGWTSWAPPCARANGTGLVAAASATDLVAVCAEGMWGTPDPGTKAGMNWLFRSADGGDSFTPVGAIPGNQPLSVTTPPGAPRTVVVADGAGGLLATFDGGLGWSSAEPGVGTGGTSNGGYVFDYVGFTSATQGVAVATKPSPALFMTRDGGHTWSQVGF